MRDLIYIICTFLILTSCNHREVCFDHSHIVNLNVAFDWTHSPEANPETMSLYLFSEDGTNPQRYELLGRDGGIIRVTPGVYHAICLNSDTRNIDCRNKEHISSFLITTKDEDISNVTTSLGLQSQKLPRPKTSAEERIAREPEMLWSGNLHNFEANKGKESHITLTPIESVIKISMSIHGVQNLRYVSSIRGTLSGLSEGIIADSGERSASCVTIPFALSKNNDGTVLSAEILTFGDCLDGDKHHYLNLYLVLLDGTKWNFCYDVTSQFHTDKDTNHIHIFLDELQIPKPEGGLEDEGGGFVPSVDGWNTVNVGINM